MAECQTSPISPTPQLERRLLDRLVRSPEGCWVFTGPLTDGYGSVYATKGRRVSAHRAAYTLYCGDPGAFYVLHRCDNRACCNPGHLFLGTQQDNIRDCHRKGRAFNNKGELHPNARLKAEQVLAIRAAAAAGTPRARIARRFRLRERYIYAIVARKIWRSI